MAGARSRWDTILPGNRATGTLSGCRRGVIRDHADNGAGMARRLANRQLVGRADADDRPNSYPPGTLAFIDKAASGPSTSPSLSIYYTPRLGTPRGATIDKTALTDRMGLGVNVANGNLMVSNDDFTIAGTGLSESVDRTYNNLSPAAGFLGNGWAGTANAPATLQYLASDAITLTEPDGSDSVWDVDGQGGFIAPPGMDATLCTTRTQAGCPGLIHGDYAQLAFQSGERWEFASVPSCSSCYALVADIDQNGNQITYSYSNGKLSQITDTHGRTTTIAYGTNGNVSGITDNAGGRSTSYGYAASGAHLTTYIDADNNTTQYTYTTNNASTTILAQITDPAGEVTKFSYDSTGRVTSILRVTNNATGAGDTTTYAYYGPSGVPITCTPPSGELWYGETVKTVYPTGTTNPGEQTVFCYDTHDRVFQTVDAYGYRTTDTYNADDDTTSSADPLTYLSQTTYTSATTGCVRPYQTIAPPAAPTDSPAASTDHYAASCTSTNVYQPATFEPDYTKDPEQNQTNYTYDNNGNLYTETLPLTGSPQIVIHHVLTNECGSQTCYGLVDYTKDADGHQTNYGYYTSGNNAGDLKTVTPPSPLGQMSYTYDADSRIASQTDGKGQTVKYQYDGLDHIKQETFLNADGTTAATVTYTVDPDGNVTKVVDSATGTSNYTYDLKNRLTNEASPGENNTYGYDGADNLTTVQDAGGTVAYGYDLDNRLTSVQEPGVSSPITFTSDIDSRRICTSYPNGVVVQTHYDDASNVLSVKAANGSGAACNPSDPNGTPLGHVFATYVYTYNQGTADTGLRQTLDVNSAPTPFSFTYDGLDRLVEENGGGLAQALNYQFDPAGNITQMQKPTQTGATTTTYAYNSANEICWAYTGTTSNTCTNPPTGAKTYSYDADGDMTVRPDSGGTTSLGYNVRSQTTSVNPDGAGAQTLGYLGDGQTHPTQIGNPNGSQSAPMLTTNVLGISSQAPVGGTPVSYYTRDTDGTLLSKRTSTGNYYQVEDANGSIVALTDHNGNVTSTFAYDPWGTCTSTSCPPTDTFGFDGGFLMAGGLYHFGKRYYDPTSGAWTQEDSVGQTADPTQSDRYAFVGDDPVDYTDPTGCLRWGRCIASCIREYGAWTLEVAHSCGACLTGFNPGACATCLAKIQRAKQMNKEFAECIVSCNDAGAEPAWAKGIVNHIRNRFHLGPACGCAG